MRIYSNYEPAEEPLVIAQAKELGLTLSAFQKYCVMLYTKQETSVRTSTSNIATLTSQMLNNLTNFSKGETFIVSSLLPDKWPDLSRSDKMTLSLALTEYVNKHPSLYAVKKHITGKTKQYVIL